MKSLLRLLAAGICATAMLVSPAMSADIILKLAHNANTDDPGHIGSVRFAELVAEKTDGVVEVQVFPNGQLGSERELVEGVLIGNVDIIRPASAVVANFVPELNVLNMPFLFRDEAHKEAALRGPLLERLNEVLAEKGLRLLGVFSTGTRHLMSKQPIFGIEDLKGLKIRTLENPVHVFAFNTFGANATPIAYPELYGALQTGVVDGAEAANTNYHSMKFYEVAPYWAILGWISLMNPVLMTESKFQSLPPEVQEAILEAGEEASKFQRELYARSDEEKLSELLKLGVKVTIADPSGFREAAEAVYDEYLTTDLDRELLQLIQDAE